MDYKIRNPRDSKEVGKVFELLESCFPRLGRKYFIKRILGDPAYRKSDTYILINGGRIVSHAHLFAKKIWNGGKKVRFTGLGAICTLPEFRNKGYASTLIREIVRRRETPIMGLFTRIPEYYRQFGFSVIPREKFVIKKDDWPDFNISGARIRRFNFHKDILRVIEIHRRFFSRLTGFTARESGNWKSQWSYFNEDKKLFLVLTVQGKIRAYIRCKRLKYLQRKSIEIVEFASKDKAVEYMPYFISQLFKLYGIGEAVVSKIYFSRNKLNSKNIKKVSDSSMMLRLDRRKLSLFRKNKKLCYLEADGF